MGGDGFRPDRRPWPAEIPREVDEELAAHLAERRDEYTARGLSPDDAERAAAQRFGDRRAVARACERIDRRVQANERRTGLLADLRQDVAYALRMFRRSPGFAAIAILTLALGTGATTTIFTLANWTLLRPVPGVTDPGNVSVIWVGRSGEKESFRVARLSYPNLVDAGSRLKTMSLGAYQGSGLIAVAGGGQRARNVSHQYVTASYFEVLGVRLQKGRHFTAAEDTPPSPFLGAVISDRLWRSMFDRDPDVLERTLDVAGVRFAILGVTAPGFHGTERLTDIDLWLPGASTPIVRHMPAMRYDARNSGGYYELVARLKPGVTWPQAQAELESLRAWLREQHPDENAGFRTNGFHLMGPIGPSPLGRGRAQRAASVTAGWASALVLLIACANVAGLLAIRGVSRRAEVGVRMALGAGRGRLVRQHIAEGLLLWLLGGACGLFIVLLLRETGSMVALIGLPNLDLMPEIDWRVLAFTALVSLAVGLLSALVPAIRTTAVDAAVILRSATPAATSRRGVGMSFAVLQVAASLTLLVGAFLIAATVRHLTRVPLGFDPQGLFAVQLQPTMVGYSEAASLEYLAEFQRRLRQVPGVLNAAAANGAPFFGGSNFRARVGLPESAESSRPEAFVNFTFSPEYFDTLRIPLVRGRAFVESEFADARRGESRVIMISEQLARRLFGAADGVGRDLECPGRRAQRCTVIGVVGTARYRSLAEAAEDTAYQPAPPKWISSGATLIVRTSDGVPIVEHAHSIASALNPAMPLTAIVPMDEAVGRARRDWVALGRLLVILGAVATVLACVGLYGVVAHGVAQRRREFGIRAALGASPDDVWRLVVRQSFSVIGTGVTIGLAGAYAFAQFLSSRLVGVDALDPVLWAMAAGALVVPAAAASLKPAFTASRVDLTETLRAL